MIKPELLMPAGNIEKLKYEYSLLNNDLKKNLILEENETKSDNKFNITKNDYVIVQQEWLRAAFRRLYKINNIIV